jgi:hypothetical protein
MLALCEGNRSFMLCPLYVLGEIPMVPVGYIPTVPIGKEAGWATELVWTLEKRKLSQPYQQLQFFGHSTCSLVTVLTELSIFLV